MPDADACPADCNHETFEYCSASGTHCDKHCVCQCYMCRRERTAAEEEHDAS